MKTASDCFVIKHGSIRLDWTKSRCSQC